MWTRTFPSSPSRVITVSAGSFSTAARTDPDAAATMQDHGNMSDMDDSPMPPDQPPPPFSASRSRRGKLRNCGAAVLLLVAGFCFWQSSGTLFEADVAEQAVAAVAESAPAVPRPDEPEPVGQSESGVALGTRAIEEIDVGQWVLAQNPTGEEDLEFGLEVDPDTWRLIELRAPKEDGSYADVRMLRPLWWLEEQANPPTYSLEIGYDDLGESYVILVVDEPTVPAESTRFDPATLVGQTLYISVPECGIDGDAHVLSIGQCPQISPRPGPEFQVATATFKHHGAQVLDLYIDGLDAPIGATPNHPFWSEDRQEFVRADELVVGERLLQADASITTLVAVTQRPGIHSVYNLEVQVEHTYHVAANGILVHNGGPCRTIGLGKSAYLAELGDVHIARGNGWTRAGLTDYLSDNVDDFRFAFSDATRAAKEIRFNLRGVNINKMWSEFADATVGPIQAKRWGLLAEWELRQVIRNPELLKKTVLVHGGTMVSGRNIDEFYEFLSKLQSLGT